MSNTNALKSIQNITGVSMNSIFIYKSTYTIELLFIFMQKGQQNGFATFD